MPGLSGGGLMNDLSRAGFRQFSRASTENLTDLSRIDPSEKPRRPRDPHQAPRTDIGTIAIHWTAAIACFISLATGLRLASDAEDSVVYKKLVAILPQGEIWSWHIISGLTLFFAASSYIVYMHRSGLKRRSALGKVRALALPAARRVKWGAVNVLLHWSLYGLLTVMTTTGVLLYLGHGGWVVTIHSTAASLILAYIAAHLLGHFGYGGLQQLLRILKPAALVATNATRPRPLLIAASVGSVVAATLVALDYNTGDTLVMGAVTEAPKLDGVLDDAVWKTARPVFVKTMQGANLRGTGESLVEIRAVHDAKKVYFAFRWQDPSRSLRRLPLIKKEDGWHLLGNNPDTADVTTFYEDKFAVLFSRSDGFGNGGSTHMGQRPLGDKPAPLNKRGYHYTTDGTTLDMWQWKASRGGMLGYVDDMFVAAPTKPSEMEAAGRARYQAGYWGDPGVPSYTYNFKIEPGHKGPAPVVRLPKDLAANAVNTAGFTMDPDSIDLESSRWWMTPEESDPYSPELDARIPLGTIIPGVIIPFDNTEDRGHVHGGAKWKDGYWTLETVRDLDTGSKYDIPFVPGQDLFMWVSVFDHNQTRHTRHMRAVKLAIR
jgi:cytochrome b561